MKDEHGRLKLTAKSIQRLLVGGLTITPLSVLLTYVVLMLLQSNNPLVSRMGQHDAPPQVEPHLYAQHPNLLQRLYPTYPILHPLEEASERIAACPRKDAPTFVYLHVVHSIHTLY